MPTKTVNIDASGQLEEIVRSTNIAKTMNECLWVGDREHKTLYINPVFEKLSGYSLGESVGKDCTFFFDEEGAKTINEAHKIRKHGHSSQYEATMVSKKGEKVPLLISGAPTKNGGTIGVFVNLKDIKNLEKEKRLAQQIVKNSSEAIVVLDQKKRIKLWNSGAETLFGFTEEEAVNKKINTMLVPPEKLEENEQIIEEIETKDFIKNYETQRMNKKGNTIDVSFSVTKVTDENKQFIGYLVIYRDITDRKNLSDQLQKRFESIQDAYKELGFQKRQNDYFFEISEAATSKSSLRSLCQLVLSAATMLTKCDGSTLRIYKDESGSIELLSSLGVEENWKGRNRMTFVNSLAEEAFKKQRPIIIHDLETAPKFRGQKIAKQHGFRSCIVIPLILGKKFIGNISLYSADPGQFRLIETDFLEKFANQCALAIFAKLQIKKISQKKATKK